MQDLEALRSRSEGSKELPLSRASLAPEVGPSLTRSSVIPPQASTWPPAQLALRISASSTSVTVIAAGAGCSIASIATVSTTTVSTTGAIGCFTFRAAFFTGARFGLALATVRFTAFATLRALPRLAEFALRVLARLCTFDPFLRLAMIAPWSGSFGNAH